MSLIERLGASPQGPWLIATVVVQLAVVILAAELVARTRLRRRAAARHRVWCWALACTLLGPAVVLLAECTGATLPVVPWVEVPAGPDQPRTIRPHVPPDAIAAATFDPANPSASSPRRVATTGAAVPSTQHAPASGRAQPAPPGPENRDQRFATELVDAVAKSPAPTVRSMPAPQAETRAQQEGSEDR